MLGRATTFAGVLEGVALGYADIVDDGSCGDVC